MDFKVIFENPMYISVGDPDTLKVTYRNAIKYLEPQEKGRSTIPDGFTMTIKLPPQGRDLLSKKQLRSMKDSAQQVVLSQLIMAMIFKQVLAMILG